MCPVNNNSFQIISILIVLLVSIIGVISTWLLFFAKYKHEYYKMIIAKRLAAYEKLEIFLSNFFIRNVNLKNNNRTFFHNMFLNEDKNNEFYNDLLNLNKNSTWLTKEVQMKLKELIDLYSKTIYPEIKNSGYNKLKEIGVKYSESFDNLFIDVHKIFRNDFKKLYKVRKFLKNMG